jgi:CheY-like chemotaxis protein
VIEPNKKRFAEYVVPPVSDSITVLLVENEQMVRKLAKRILLAQGYQVIDYSSGEKALAFFEENDRAISLLLTDLIMPGMSGKALHDRLMQKNPDLKAVFLSSYNEKVIQEHVALDKNNSFVQKPFAIETLIQTVRGLLQQ